MHLVRYVSALEGLFDQITLDLIAARGELIRRAPARREDEPDADNPVVLFGQPIETLRSAPAINQGALMTQKCFVAFWEHTPTGLWPTIPAMVIIATPTLQFLNPLQPILTVRPMEKPRHPQGTPA